MKKGKLVNNIIVSLGLFFVSISNICASQNKQTPDTFIITVKDLATKYGAIKVGERENESRNPFVYIPNDNGQPFAVIKEGLRSQKESFISAYTRKLGLDNVAISESIQDLSIKDQPNLFKGLVEEYLSIDISDPQIPEDLSSLIKKYEKKDSLILQSIIDSKNKDDIKILLKYLDKESVHKFFSYVILVKDIDSDSRNIALRINKNNKIEFYVFDTEHAFGSNYKKLSYHKLSLIFSLPFVDKVFSKKVRDIVLSWTPENIADAKKLGLDESVYIDQMNRIQDFQNFIRTYSELTPMDIMLFAFFKTPRQEHLDTPEGAEIVSALQLAKMKALNPDSIDDFGRFFDGGLQDSYSGYLAAIYDYNTPNESQNENDKNLKDFLGFLMTRSYFKQEKRDEFKDYVKGKFGYDL